jgi:hypothetical protein
MNEYDTIHNVIHNVIYNELKSDNMTIEELTKLNQCIQGLIFDKLNEIDTDNLIYIDSNIIRI